MDIISKLQQSHDRFRNKFYKLEPELFQELSTGQSPKVMLITCADSRICPDLLFGTKPGELFVVRNVANLVHAYDEANHDYSDRAALEYGVLHLNVEHIVVLGHSQCGGIKAMMANQAGTEIGEFIDPWLRPFRPVADEIAAVASDISGDQQCAQCELAAIRKSLDHLSQYPWIQSRLSQNLQLHGWHFNIETGEISKYDSNTQSFS